MPWSRALCAVAEMQRHMEALGGRLPGPRHRDSEPVGRWAGEAAFPKPGPHSVLMQPGLGPGVEEPPGGCMRWKGAPPGVTHPRTWDEPGYHGGDENEID